MGIEVTPSTLNSSCIVTASIAPSDAPADTPSVNGVASGLRSSACSTTPAAASVAPTSRAGQHARQPGDEEDLRVDVRVPGDRAIEGLAQRDWRAADRRRPQHHRDRDQRERRRSTMGRCGAWIFTGESCLTGTTVM